MAKITINLLHSVQNETNRLQFSLEQFFVSPPWKQVSRPLSTSEQACGYQMKTEFLFSHFDSALLRWHHGRRPTEGDIVTTDPISLKRGVCARVEHGRQPVLVCARIFLFFSQHHGNDSKKSSMLSPYSMYINDKHCPWLLDSMWRYGALT